MQEPPAADITARAARRRGTPRGRVRLLRALGLLAAALAAPHALSQAIAIPPAPGCTALPFAQQLDVGLVRTLAHLPPQALLPRIAGLGIELQRVPSATAERPANPLLLALPVAEPGLLPRAGFEASTQGRAIPRAAECCGMARDTVLIRDTASTYTLLHEVAHLLIQPLGMPPRVDVEQRFAAAFHRLSVYQRRLYDEPARLLDPRWRRDILSAQREAAELLHDRIRIGQSQEAIVEQVLGRCIDETSPYRDAARREEGWRYGLAMVDNAVDVFNTLHASIEFCDDTVQHLHGDLAAGRLTLPEGGALDAGEVAAYAEAARSLRQTLAGTREAIEALKRFYAAAP